MLRKFFCFAPACGGGGNAGRVNRQNPLDFAQRKFGFRQTNAHQTGFCKFLEADNKTRSPRLVARLAGNEIVKSNGRTKSQETIFSEMRRFVPIFLTKSEISARNFGEAIQAEIN